MLLKKAKRLLYLCHRWLGIALCLWFALLFASGVIMMYVEYPELTEEERLWQMEPLQAAAVQLSANDAARISGSDAFISVKLVTVTGRPAYQLTDTAGRLHTVFADNGEVQAQLTAAAALEAARHSGFAGDGIQPRYDALIDIDQWTVSSVLHPERPLHRIHLDDADGTVLYVSDRSGQIVRDSNRRERFWNWLGSTIHWIYPWQFRQHQQAWTWLLTYLSLAGVLSVASGAVVGWWRLRVRRKFHHGSTVTPYSGWHKWHHLLGLGCVIFISTWIFSGLMSMYPWGIFDNATNADEQLARYYGGPLDQLDDFPQLNAALQNGKPVKEVEWRRLGNVRYLVLRHDAADSSTLLPAGIGTHAPLQSLIHRNTPALQPQAHIAQQRTLTQYDSWYYSHHNRHRPLPVLELRFDDAERSWYHIDLNTGAVVQRLTATDRWARWLYNGLHSLDFAALFQHRPLWDITLITLLLAGFVFSLTAVMIGWRRIKA